MRVLSIDLDYIMAPSIELYETLQHDANPTTRWNQLFDNSDFRDCHFILDQGNLLFCFDIFLRALKHCNNVSFGYEHDAILFDLADKSKINLINIDHHDDVLEPHYSNDYDYETALQKGFEEVCNANRVHEGNWIAWLATQKKIDSYTWIGNNNSSCKRRNSYNQTIIPNYWNVEREDYKFDNYKFDHIFVCLSPQYIPKNHWHYFTMFMQACEHSGKKIKIHKQKYEIKMRHAEVDKVLTKPTK